MKNKMIDALIFESKGYFLKANEIYDEILKWLNAKDF